MTKLIVRIDSHVSFNFKKLSDKACLKILKKKFTHVNPVYIRNERIGIPNDREPKVYKNYEVRGKRIYFARGGLKKIRKVLKRHGHRIKIKDNRVTNPTEIYTSKTKLRKEQVPAVEACLNKTQGIMRGPCSSGKSVIGLEFIAMTKEKGLVVVWEKTHQIQWIKEALRDDLIGLKPEEIGGCGGVFSSKKDWEAAIPEMPYPGNKKVKKLNIVMLQSLRSQANQDLYFPVCGTLVADEVQRYGANTFNDTILFCPAKNRIGVSADEKRRDGKEFLIYDAFGPIVHIIPDTDIGSRKKARINLLPTTYENDAYEFNKNNPELLNDMARDKKRNKIIINRTLQKTSKKKLVLILVERKYQALYLWDELTKKDLKVKLLVGKFSSKDISEADDWKPNWKKFAATYNDDQAFFEIKTLGNQKKIDVVIATQKGNAGLSLKTIDHGIATTPTGDNTELFNQQKGRVERDYDDELKKLFGRKATPSFDYLWDIKIEKLRNKGKNILRNYSNVHVLQRGKKNGKKKSES